MSFVDQNSNGLVMPVGQMDEAKTDYERQLVEKEIQRLRRGDR